MAEIVMADEERMGTTEEDAGRGLELYLCGQMSTWKNRLTPWKKEIFWILIFCLRTAGCRQQMYGVWKKYEESPIILSFGNNMKSLSEIPFPAVTICIDSGLNKALVGYFKNTSAHERKKLMHLAQLTCGIYDWIEGRPKNVDEVVDFLKLVSAPLDMSVSDCKYRTVSEDCGNLFSPVLIDRELCYTFNGLVNDEVFRGVKTLKWWQSENETFSYNWNLKNGYQLPEDDTTPVLICSAPEQCFRNVSTSCGGILFLLLGFSIMSLVEVIYYLSVYFSNKRRIMLSQASLMASIY